MKAGVSPPDRMEDRAAEPPALPGLRAVRRSCGLSQQALARKAELSLDVIWRCENRPGQPQRRTIRDLARALQCSPLDLLRGGGN